MAQSEPLVHCTTVRIVAVVGEDTRNLAVVAVDSPGYTVVAAGTAEAADCMTAGGTLSAVAGRNHLRRDSTTCCILCVREVVVCQNGVLMPFEVGDIQAGCDVIR